MSQRDALIRYDGWQTLAGVDSGRAPSVLDRTQLSWLVNGITRGGVLQCRPGWIKQPLVFLDQFANVDATTQSNFQTAGRWQGAGAYEGNDGHLSLLAAIGGRVFAVALDSMSVQDLTAQINDQFDPISEQVWMTQAESYMVIQNGEESPFVYDGSVLKRTVASALGGTSVPIGTCMAYNNGRLWVALPGGHAFVAGDLAYSGATGTPADLLQFTENTFLAGGGAFVVTAQAGPIRAMCSIAAQDSVTGQGPLQVMTTRGAFSINAPFDRTQWQTTVNPIETISLLAAGAVSQNATLNVNGDIWFRSPDGVRSFMIARREHNTWVNTPSSNEMVRTFNYDAPELLPFASAALFDNRWIVTSQPSVVKNAANVVRGIAHRALGVLDFYPINSMASQLDSSLQPEWQGMWTGLNVLQLVTIGSDAPRCFAFVINSNSEIELWELTKDGRFDNGTQRISWAIESPAYGFDTGGWNLRQLWYGDTWLTRVAGQVDLSLKFRPDADPVWRTWHTTQTCAPIQDCDTPRCGTPNAYREQYRSRVRFPEPDAVCDQILDQPVNRAYRFAVRLDITGFCAIPQFRIAGKDQSEDVVGACSVAVCQDLGVTSACIVNNDLEYVIN